MGEQCKTWNLHARTSTNLSNLREVVFAVLNAEENEAA